MIAMYLERLRTRVLKNLEDFPMYAHYGRGDNTLLESDTWNKQIIE